MPRTNPIEPASPQAAGKPAPTHAVALKNFDALPDSAFVREAQLIAKNGRPGLLPFSSGTLWNMVKADPPRFPRPVKLSERVTAWKVGEVRAWMRGREGKA